MLKAGTPVVTMLVLLWSGLQPPTRGMVSAVVVITAGIASASFGEVAFSAVGAALMAASSWSRSAR